MRINDLVCAEIWTEKFIFCLFQSIHDYRRLVQQVRLAARNLNREITNGTWTCYCSDRLLDAYRRIIFPVID